MLSRRSQPTLRHNYSRSGYSDERPQVGRRTVIYASEYSSAYLLTVTAKKRLYIHKKRYEFKFEILVTSCPCFLSTLKELWHKNFGFWSTHPFPPLLHFIGTDISFIITNFMTCILHWILLGWLNRGGLGGRDMWHAWGRGRERCL
jgi:hypothetical protein